MPKFEFDEKRFEKYLDYFRFEFNDETTRNTIRSGIDQWLGDYKARHELYDYMVICDETNNTPKVVDSNEIKIDISLKDYYCSITCLECTWGADGLKIERQYFNGLGQKIDPPKLSKLMTVNRTYTTTKVIDRCIHQCPYYGTEGGPGPIMVCEHPMSIDNPFIISYDEKDMPFPSACPLFK